MANAELGILLQSLRGKVGNAVFVKSKGGTVVRTRVKGTNPNTGPQQGVRSYLSRSAQAYKNMSTLQIVAWKAYAATQTHRNKRSGKAFTPSAIDEFTSLSAKFLQVNPTGTIPLTPPTSSFAGDNVTVTATPGTGKVTFTASNANGLNVKTEVLLQTLKSKNRVPGTKGYRSKGFVAFTVGNLSLDVNVPAGAYAAAYRFVNVSTGQESPLVPIGLQVVSLSVSQGQSKQSKKAA